MNLNFGLQFAQLYQRDGLVALDAQFLQELNAAAPALAGQLAAARLDPEALAPKAESALLIEVGPYVEDFIAKLFRIEAAVGQLAQSRSIRLVRDLQVPAGVMGDSGRLQQVFCNLLHNALKDRT